MAFPIIKLAFVTFKYISRPLNNLIIRILKARGANNSLLRSRKLFERCGQFAHTWEIKLNRMIVQEQITKDEQELKLYIKPLSSDAAFNKGVEYFSELVFFYGVLLALAIYEIRKSHESSEKQIKQVDKMEERLDE
jgi:hypothetical protein